MSVLEEIFDTDEIVGADLLKELDREEKGTIKLNSHDGKRGSPAGVGSVGRECSTDGGGAFHARNRKENNISNKQGNKNKRKTKTMKN